VEMLGACVGMIGISLSVPIKRRLVGLALDMDMDTLQHKRRFLIPGIWRLSSEAPRLGGSVFRARVVVPLNGAGAGVGGAQRRDD